MAYNITHRCLWFTRAKMTMVEWILLDAHHRMHTNSHHTHRQTVEGTAQCQSIPGMTNWSLFALGVYAYGIYNKQPYYNMHFPRPFRTQRNHETSDILPSPTLLLLHPPLRVSRSIPHSSTLATAHLCHVHSVLFHSIWKTKHGIYHKANEKLLREIRPFSQSRMLYCFCELG